MNEYYTPPSDIVAGVRARSTKINDVIDSVDTGFDNIPADLANTIAALVFGSGVAVTVNDLSIGYLTDKLLAGSNTVFTVGNPGGSETLTMTVSFDSIINVAEVVNVLGDLTGGTDDIDYTLGGVVTATVSTAEQTFTFSNPPTTGKNGSFMLFLTNGGSQTVNWPASVKWSLGSAPTLTISGTDIISFTTLDAGVTWYGFMSGWDMS